MKIRWRSTNFRYWAVKEFSYCLTIWLLDLANVESLTLTSTTLQILSLLPDLLEAFRLEPPAIPDGIVDFLQQNSPSAEVNISTDFLHRFNLKQVAEAIKGAKIVKYRLRYAAPGSCSIAPASATAPASVAVPPNLHLYCDEKDGKSSNEDKVENHQPNTNSLLLDNGQ
ncbi:hypothetical protein P8452_38471 [Trifolium repens]|nr:hypothetical protein P8452_38471 [Trifolium repens]